MMPPDAVVTLTDVKVHHGGFTLDVPGLSFPKGRVVGLVGPNGCGKSTMLRLLPGLDRPSAGEVRVLGLDPVASPVEVRNQLSWMSDDMPVFNLRIQRLLHLLSGLYDTWDHELVIELVDRFDVDLSARVGNLSKGEGTRLRLVLALAYRPQVLVLDEPATGLDLAGRRALLRSVLDLSQDPDRTVIISSHALSDVHRIADHLVVMKEGRIVQDGPMDALVPDDTSLEERLMNWNVLS
jgi:ABC-2 type transport system ATP-binding protein